jgi:polyisoprenoid-binding protein YceI
MTRQISISALTCAVVLGLIAAPGAIAQDASAPLALTSAKVSLAGTSNIHEFTASTTDVRVTRLAVTTGVGGPGLLAAVVNPGAVEAFEIAVRASALSSPKEGLDKNMHKALKVTEFKDITFRLLRLEATAGPASRAVGVLKIAGVEREVAFDLKTTETPTALTVTGTVPLLMTDYGITPPKAMLGMLKTDPKITVTFEVILAAPTTLTR